jgi:predicted nucleotidyltransferase
MLQKSTILKVLEIFFLFPTKKHYLKDISRRINIAHTSVKKNLDILLKKKLIIKESEKRGTRNFPLYKANIDNPDFRNQKKIYNYSEILNSGLINFLEEKLTPKTIVLFGSYQRGEDIEESDVDLFLECPKENVNLKEYEKILNRKVEVHFRNSFDFFPEELKNNIANGIVLKGFLKCFDDTKNNRGQGKSKKSKKNGSYKSSKTKRK